MKRKMTGIFLMVVGLISSGFFLSSIALGAYAFGLAAMHPGQMQLTPPFILIAISAPWLTATIYLIMTGYRQCKN